MLIEGKILTKNGYRIDWLPQVISDDVDNMNVEVSEYLMHARFIEKYSLNMMDGRQKTYEMVDVYSK